MVISPGTLRDLMVTAIESKKTPWLRKMTKVEGLNEIDPFWRCEKFWTSPFRIQANMNGQIKEVTVNDLGMALAYMAEKEPFVIINISEKDYSQADALKVLALMIQGVPGG